MRIYINETCKAYIGEREKGDDLRISPWHQQHLLQQSETELLPQPDRVNLLLCIYAPPLSPFAKQAYPSDETVRRSYKLKKKQRLRWNDGRLGFTDLVVEAWAMMLPPIGLIWGPAKTAEPSTWATTWLVMTTATPNCNNSNHAIKDLKQYFYPIWWLGLFMIFNLEIVPDRNLNSRSWPSGTLFYFCFLCGSQQFQI